MDKHIPYGIQYGKRVTIHQLNQNERGSNCNCTCEMCGYPLVAIFSDPEVMRPHFRHEKGHIHCHFEYDEYMMNLIFEMLKEIDESMVVEILNTGIEHFSVKDKDKQSDTRVNKHNEAIQNVSFTRTDRKEVLFKIIIDGEEFQIRITCRKLAGLNPDEKLKYINIADLIASNDSITQERLKTIINQILERLKEKTQDDYEKFKRKNIKEESKTTATKTEKPELKVNFNENSLPKEHIKSKVEPDFSDYTIRNGICPRCQSGKIVERISSYSGKPFFGCSNFPRCNYKHFGTEYYDEELKKWIYLTR